MHIIAFILINWLIVYGLSIITNDVDAYQTTYELPFKKEVQLLVKYPILNISAMLAEWVSLIYATAIFLLIGVRSKKEKENLIKILIHIVVRIFIYYVKDIYHEDGTYDISDHFMVYITIMFTSWYAIQSVWNISKHLVLSKSGILLGSALVYLSMISYYLYFNIQVTWILHGPSESMVGIILSLIMNLIIFKYY